jgi:hypothetical protein
MPSTMRFCSNDKAEIAERSFAASGKAASHFSVSTSRR